MQLFRPEALAGQDRLHGDVVLVPQVSWRLLGIFLAASLAAATLFLSLAHYADVERGEGRVESAAPADGVLRARVALSQRAAAALDRGGKARIAIPGRTDAVEIRIAPPATARGTGRASIEAELPLEAAATLRPGMPVALFVESRPRSLADRLLARLGGERR